MDMLQYLISCGKIDPLEITREMDNMKRKAILKQHQYRIWQGKNGKWYTYLPDAKRGRAQKSSMSLQQLEDKICAYYREREENPLIRELFEEWVNRKTNNEEIEKSTATRYRTDFERCFTVFGEKRVCDVTELDIEDFMRESVKEKNMKHKAYSNLRTLVYGIFRLAKKKGLITFDIKTVVEGIDFSKKSFNTETVDDKLQVFFATEEAKVIDLLEQNQDAINLGLLLMFHSGLRVGELAALRPSDIDVLSQRVHISRTETKWKDPETKKTMYTVKEHPKTDAGIRDVYINDNALWILQKLLNMNPHGEYLFMKGDKRIRTYQFRTRIYTSCKRCNIKPKSPHKVRKTYGTKLYDSAVAKSFISDQMGHTDITCLEKYYYFGRQTETDKINTVNSISVL